MKENAMKSMASSCRRSLNVESAASNLSGAVEELGCAMGELEVALEPLLSCERPCPIGEDREAGPSQVADRVMSDAARVRQHANRIRELIERL